MSGLRAAMLAALFLVASLASARAQDVTLLSRDGAVELSGTLLGFDGEFYRIDTIYGELTVDGSGVRCEGPACPNLTDFVAQVTVSGSSTMGRVLLPALIEAYALRHGYSTQRVLVDDTQFEYVLADRATGRNTAVFTIRTGDSDTGFADLLAGETDMVLSMREIRQAEADAALAQGLGDLRDGKRSLVLALDGLVAVTPPGSSIRKISPSELARVFSGDLVALADLGGPDAPLAAHVYVPDGGVEQAIEDRFLADTDAGLPDTVRRHLSEESFLRAVLQDPFALGVTLYSAAGTAEILGLTGTCGFSLDPNPGTIQTEDYPLTTAMFLYLPTRRLPQVAREFLAYTRSPSAQIVIRRTGFIDQATGEIPLAAQGDRLANAIRVSGADLPLSQLQAMTDRLAALKRLTTTFRFEAGSARLDAQSRFNVQQLARALENGVYDGRKLVFVGFSDGDGPAAANLDIARKRAETVREAVVSVAETLDSARVLIETDAYGEAMPMACDDSAWGRSVNRRVEVWID